MAMLNPVYRNAYLASSAVAFSASACSALWSGAWRGDVGFSLVILFSGVALSIVPALFSKELEPRDFSVFAMGLPKKLQVVSACYRMTIVYAIPFLALMALPYFHDVVFRFVCLYALALLAQPLFFPFGSDGIACRLMACCVLVVAGGHHDSVVNYALGGGAVAACLCSVTLFLLSHNYHKHESTLAKGLIKLCLADNVRVLLLSGFFATVVTMAFALALPAWVAAPLPSDLDVEGLLPTLFGSKFLGSLVFLGVSLAAVLAIYRFLAKYVKPKGANYLVGLETDYQIDADEMDDVALSLKDVSRSENRRFIIDRYLAARAVLAATGFDCASHMTPNEIAVAAGKRSGEIKNDVKHLTTLFHWARYSSVEPKQNELDASEMLLENIIRKLTEAKGDSGTGNVKQSSCQSNDET